MPEYVEDHTEHGTRTFAFATDSPITLALVGENADITIDLSGPEGRGELRFSGAAEADLQAIEAAVHEGRVSVRVPPIVTENGAGFGLSIMLGRRSFHLGNVAKIAVEVELPAGSSLDLDSGSGDVNVTGRPGALRARTGSGDVTVEEADDARVEAGSGDVHLAALRGGSVTAGSGDIHLGEASGRVHLRTGSGDIVVSEFEGDLTAASGSGDIHCPEVTGGSVDAHTGSGDVTVGVREGVPVWQELSSRSGDIDRTLSRRGEPAPGAAYVSVRAVTASGDVALIDA